MLKTNSKQARENIRRFINKIFDASNYEREDLNSADIDLKINFIASTCWAELGHEVKECHETVQNMFTHWCEGLPSLIDTASYYCKPAIPVLGDILEETEQERNKYSEFDAERLLTYLIYKEVRSELFKLAF